LAVMDDTFNLGNSGRRFIHLNGCNTG
jgi:hypothetical protein